MLKQKHKVFRVIIVHTFTFCFWFHFQLSGVSKTLVRLLILPPLMNWHAVMSSDLSGQGYEEKVTQP